MLKSRRGKAFLCLVFAFLIINFPKVFAVDGNTTIHLSGTETITIGTWDLPWPLDTYSINFYAIPSFDGSNKVSWTVDKDLISPGDSVSSKVTLGQGEHDYRMDFRVLVIDDSTGDAIVDETTGTDLGAIDVPGSWSSPSLVVPIVPFEIVGIPMELSIYFRFSLSSQYSLTLSTYGLQPQTTTLEYSSSTTKTIEFSKPSGVGADIRLTNARIEVEGSITVSAGLSVSGIPTPLQKDFMSVPLGDWVTSHSQDINMATLKTPITVEASVNTTVVTLGKYVTVSGQVSPQAKDITLQIIVEGTTVGTTETQEDGSFSFEWQPTYAGTIGLFVKSPETKYTTSASSPTINFIVNRPPQASFTYSPINPLITDEVRFTDNSLDSDGQITAWFWDFGDGYTSVDKNPVHKYMTEGTYTVKLTVTDNYGAKATYTEALTVKVPPKTPIAIGGIELLIIGLVVGALAAVTALFMIRKRHA
jgi:hypothetical protein